jgi:hypothetical protein
VNKAKVLSLFGGIFAATLATAAADVPPAPAAPAASAAPVQPEPSREAQIPFANRGGIYNWRVLDDKTVLIESRGRKWYKATLFGNCINLSFANGLAFIPNPSGTFDKFSTIRSRGQRCPLLSLVETTPPPKKSSAKKDASAATPPTTLTSPE